MKFTAVGIELPSLRKGCPRRVSYIEFMDKPVKMSKNYGTEVRFENGVGEAIIDNVI